MFLQTSRRVILNFRVLMAILTFQGYLLYESIKRFTQQLYNIKVEFNLCLAFLKDDTFGGFQFQGDSCFNVALLELLGS